MREIYGLAVEKAELHAARCGLRAIGDALRRGQLSTQEERAALRATKVDALADLIEEIAPVLALPSAPSHDQVACLVRALDLAESIALAAERLALDAPPPPRVSHALGDLARLVREARDWARAHVPLDDALAVLGDRVELNAAWLADLAPAPSEEAPDAQGADATAAPEPSDVTLDLYLSRGALAEYVEGAAARSGNFASVLRDVIEAHDEAREPVSLLALRWAHRRVVLADEPRPPATSSRECGPSTRDLGHLGPVDAEARITQEGPSLVLRVYPETAGEVTRVRLGDASTEQASDGVLRVSVPRRPGVVPLCVEGRSGACIEIDLEVRG